jgi:hypothetical protein
LSVVASNLIYEDGFSTICRPMVDPRVKKRRNMG